MSGKESLALQTRTPALLNNRMYLFLLAVVFLMHIAAFLIIPILPVFLEKARNLSVSQIGYILGVGSIAYQAGSMLSGLIADRLGRRNVIGAGSLTQAVAMFGYANSYSFYAFFAFAIVNGLGVGLAAPAIKAKIADSVSRDVRTTAFSWRGIAAHIGIITAGLVVTLFSLAMDKRVFLIASGVFFIMSLFTFWRIPNDRCEGADCKSTSLGDVKLIFGHRSFLLFCLVSLLIWALYAQLALVLPLKSGDVLNSTASIGLLWTINSLFVVLFQGLISRYILNRWNPYVSLVTGTVLLGVGLVSLGWAFNFVTLSMSAIVFIFGEMLFLPVIDTLVSHFAKEQLLGAYYGISNVIAGIGGAVGTSVGGTLVEKLGGVGSSAPWIMYGFTAVVFAGLLGLFAFYAIPRHGQPTGITNIQVKEKEKSK